MKIVIAPDSYKGSLSAFEVGQSMRRGILKVDPAIETILVPMADGGEGTVQSLIDATGGKIIEKTVHNPLFRIIKAFYGIMGDGKTAVIEMAAASGLLLSGSDERDPLKTTTYGTGELIEDAINKGCSRIILGLGGSATNDGGIGMAQALGVQFFDKKGNNIGLGGGELSRIESIDISKLNQKIKNIEFIAACDVDNPLCGINGASHVFGRQKGASEEDVINLDKGLEHFAGVMEKKLGLNFKDYPGAGAAGGLGYAVMLFLMGNLERGVDIVSRTSGLAEKMEGADLVITGEGRIDDQTACGKTPFGVSQIAKQKNIPVVALAGSLGDNYKLLYHKGFDGIFCIIDKPMLLEEAIENANELIENATESIVRFWISINKI